MPVCFPDEPCDPPQANVVVSIATEGDTVLHATTDADGWFAMALEPGRYKVLVAGKTAAEPVVVVAGAVTRIDVHIDTGIR